VPGPETWEIVLNASTSQWGIESEYTDAVRRKELGRAIVRAEATAQYQERMRFIAELVTSQGGARSVVLEWERIRVILPVEAQP
jgi:hypothetical protein